MALTEKIKSDWIAARKERNTVRASVLGVLLGNVETKGKNLPVDRTDRTLRDDEVISEINKLIKGIAECLAVIPAGSEQAVKLTDEKAALDVYMPQALSDDELKAFVDAAVADGKDFKTIMGDLKATHAGKYDGKTAVDLVKAATAK